MNMPPNVPPYGGGQVPVPPPRPVDSGRHVCFSGSLSCSGIEPCDACGLQLKEFVFKRALEHALRAEQAALIDELHAATQQMRPLNLQHLTNVAYANFFGALAACYQQVHQQIDQEMQQPPEQRSFAARNMTAIMQAAQSYQAMLRERAAANAAATAIASANGTPHGGVVLGRVANVSVPVSPAPAVPVAAAQGVVAHTAHVVYDALPPQPNREAAPSPQVVFAPPAVDFEQAMQIAEAQLPRSDAHAEPTEPTAAANGMADKNRRLTADDFAFAAETHDEEGGSPPGTSSSS